jgi:long-chain acyl-CoA synthetase
MEHYISTFQNLVKSNWNKPTLANFQGKTFTFGEIATEIERLHLVFDEFDIKKGDKIAICAKNSAEWAASFLSINTYGAVAVPILADFHPDNVNSLVDHSESTILFTDEEIWNKLDITKMPLLKAVYAPTGFKMLWCADDKHENLTEKINASMAEKYPQGYKPEHVSYKTDNLKELALINYTSGTTSAPKGVMITFEALSLNVDLAHRNFDCKVGETIVSMLPMAHMYGLAFELLFPLTGGVVVTYLGKTPTPKILLSAMAKVKPVLLITVPMVLEKVYKASVAPKLKAPALKIMLKIPGLSHIVLGKIRKKLLTAFGGNIRQIVLGGAALNPEVEYWFKRIGLPFTVGYGMTEGAPLFAYQHPERFVKKSCGKVVDYVEARIDSTDPQNVVGEIQFKGNNVMIGYYKNEEATAATFTKDGWLKTGDLGVMNPDGTLFIRGRNKNMILSSNGQNIYPEEIEAVINNYTGVIESVVLDRSGRLFALTYFDPKYRESMSEVEFQKVMDEIRDDVNKNMPSYSKVAKLEAMDAPFEKTPKMSIKRFLYS